MKVFENKSIFKKLIIVLLCILLLSFCAPKFVIAADSVGGKLLNPVIDLMLGLGDGAMNIIHTVIYHQNDTTITVDMTANILEIIGTIAIGVIIAVVVAVVIVFTAGAVVAAAAAAGITLSTIGVGTVLLVSTAAGITGAVVFNSNVLPDNIQLPVYQISPEQIFSNEVLLFDVDFFNPKEDKVAKDSEGNTIKDENGNVIYVESIAKQLRETISNWYVILRDISIVALLSILVYIGIRILISSTSNDKAKYKQLLIDWLVAICLLFIMQYIMSFSNLLVGKITDLVSDIKYDNGYFSLIEDEDGKIEDALAEAGYDVDSLKVTEDGKNYINWKTNLLGVARLNAQMAKDSSVSYAGYALIFIVLVLYTIYFVFTYLKRVLYMAFLTLIAPLVALTYPIDKMNDGKAQAFDMWFKEYIFNLLIQPMHLLLYTILVSSAFELATTNIIYSLLALGFMIPAEKLLRKFFGFEKAHTPGLLAGPAGAAATMGMMSKLLGKGSKGGGKSGSNSTVKENESSDEKPPRVNSNFDKQNAMLSEGDENNKDNDENEQMEFSDDAYQGYIDDLSNTENHMGAVNRQENPELEDYNYMYMNPNEYDENGNYIGLGQQNSDNIGQNLEENYNQNQDRLREQNILQDDQDANREDPRRIIRKTMRNYQNALKMSSKYYGKGMLNKASNKIKNANLGKAALRTAGGLAVGTATAGIGLAAGIASGDISKAVQYTTAGAIGGYKSGSGAVTGISKALTVDGINEIQERALYGSDEEYKEAKQQKYIKNYQNNMKNQVKLEQKYGAREAKKIMKDVVPKCLDNGVTNMDDIITINEMVKSGAVKDMDMGISTAKYASRIGQDTTKMKKKDRDDWNKTFASEFAKNERVKQNNMDSNKIADDVLKRVDAFNKIKNS